MASINHLLRPDRYNGYDCPHPSVFERQRISRLRPPLAPNSNTRYPFLSHRRPPLHLTRAPTRFVSHSHESNPNNSSSATTYNDDQSYNTSSDEFQSVNHATTYNDDQSHHTSSDEVQSVNDALALNTSDQKTPKSLSRITDKCPICMEKLVSVFNEEIGATVPCGHCFHWECFQKCSSSWQENKCPTCNLPISNFIRIYITTDIDKDSLDLKEEVHRSLMKSIAQNDVLKKDNLALEEELLAIAKASEAKEELLNAIPKFMKDFGDNIQRIGNGFNYIYHCIKKGCIRAESESIQHVNILFSSGALDDLSEDDSSYSSYPELLSATDNTYYGSDEFND